LKENHLIGQNSSKNLIEAALKEAEYFQTSLDIFKDSDKSCSGKSETSLGSPGCSFFVELKSTVATLLTDARSGRLIV
jgi:hypothetical protein